MASFAPAPLTIISIRRKTQSATCSLNQKVPPFASSKPGPVMQTTNFSPNDEMDDDDDDVTIGGAGAPEPGYGMPTPPLTPSDKIYLDGAKNSKEYMARMVEIARRVDSASKTIAARQAKQTADQYMSGLSKPRDPVSEEDIGEPKLDATDAYFSNLSKAKRDEETTREPPVPPKDPPIAIQTTPISDPSMVAKPTDSMTEVQEKMRAIQDEIDRVSRQNQSEANDNVSEEVMQKLDELASKRDIEDVGQVVEDMTLEEGARQIAELQRQIREAAGLEEPSESNTEEINNAADSEVKFEREQQLEPQSNPKPTIRDESLRQSHIGKDPHTVDKQIDYLEGYLSKLRSEEAQDPAAGTEISDPEEPKRDFGEDMQIAMSTVADQISKMPKDRTPFQGLDDTPGEMSSEDKMAIFAELRRRAAATQPSSEFADPLNVTLPKRNDAVGDDYYDEPSPESAAEYDSFDSVEDKALLIEEIETEVKAYSRDVKAMLQKHETRLQVLLERLRAL